MYGFYTVGKTNRQRAEQKLEDRRIRYAMAPLLQAEADREYMIREQENLKKEMEIMKNVKGWIPGQSVYHSKKFVPRNVDPMNKSA
jgi:NADH dehydrogenase (ubiquinone) 1 alpha subcomplex subunit 13